MWSLGWKKEDEREKMKIMPLDNVKWKGRLIQSTKRKGKEEILENSSVKGQFNLHIKSLTRFPGYILRLVMSY